MTCRCTLHSRKDHTDACRLCVAKHPTSRTAARSLLGQADQRQLEKPDTRARTRPADAGFSPDPALPQVAALVPERVRAGSPRHS